MRSSSYTTRYNEGLRDGLWVSTGRATLCPRLEKDSLAGYLRTGPGHYKEQVLVVERWKVELERKGKAGKMMLAR